MEIFNHLILSITGLSMGIGFLVNDKNIGTIVLFIVFLSLFILRLLFSPSIFADYSSYVIYNDYLVDVPGYFEILSKSMFKLSTLLFDYNNVGIYPVYYMVFLVVLLSIYIINVNYQVSHKNILIVLAVFGPLLLFVTLRASIAYMLITLLFLRNFKLDVTGIFLIIIGALFHISTLLVLPPILIYKITTRDITDCRHDPIILFVISFVYGLIEIFSPVKPLSTFLGLFPLVGDFSKFQIYIDPDLVSESIFHKIYFAAIFMFGMWLFFIDKYYCKQIVLRKYIIFSSFYFMMSFTPVVAFRYSMFFMVPTLLELDLLNMFLLKKPLVMLLVTIFIIIGFIVSFRGVLEQVVQ